MSAKNVARRHKESAAGGDPPSSLVVLLRRCITSKYAKYQRYYGVAEPHLFTYPASTRLSITGSDLKILLKNGMTRIQCNEPNEVTFYFGPLAEDVADSINFKALGKEAFKNGLSAVPAQDPTLREALKTLQGAGTKATIKALDEWTRGWDEANLAAPML